MNFVPSPDIRISKLLLRETGTYNDQWSRPYETAVNGDTISALQERYNGGESVSPSLLAGVAYSFISPSGTPEREISIVNGWGSKRFQFLMEVEMKSVMGVATTQVLMGYTDYAGLSLQGTLDPNMVFVINSTISLRREVGVGAFGANSLNIAGESNHILAENAFGGVFNTNGTNEFRMRPTDVFSVMTRTNVNLGQAGAIDTRTLNTSAPVKSRRTNGMASSFASNLLSNYATAVNTGDMYTSQDEVMANARGNVAEGTVTQDPFMKAIANSRGNTVANYFTFGDLLRLDPNVKSDQVTVVVVAGEATKMIAANEYVHTRGDTANWGAATLNAQFATVIGQAVPGLLMSMGLMRLAFTATNATINGLMETSIAVVVSFSGSNAGNNDIIAVEKFFKLLEINVMRDITRNGEVLYRLRCDMRLTGDSTIEVALDGGELIPYNLPTFADALFSPIMTNNDNRAVVLAGDFQKIFRGTIDAHESRPDPVLAGQGLYGNI